MKNESRVPFGTDMIRHFAGGDAMVATARIRQRQLPWGDGEHPSQFLSERPVYQTNLGGAYAGDAINILRALPDASVQAVITSPPYALHFKKEYGNVEKHGYGQWMLPFAREIKRVLKSNGSFVLNIGGSYNAGSPTRSLYHFKLLIALVEEVGFHLAQECFWHNPAKLPSGRGIYVSRPPREPNRHRLPCLEWKRPPHLQAQY